MTSDAAPAAGAGRPRRRARELVLQGLYQRQLAGQAPEEIGAQLRESEGYASADAGYFAALWDGVAGEFDALVASFAPLLDRAATALSPIERAILAIGAWELAHRAEIPYKVVIDEAVELAKAYGATDGYKYVNGVLDRLAQALRAGETGPAAPGGARVAR